MVADELLPPVLAEMPIAVADTRAVPPTGWTPIATPLVVADEVPPPGVTPIAAPAGFDPARVAAEGRHAPPGPTAEAVESPSHVPIA